MNSRNVFTELKRRNVLRAAAFYAASAWLLVQVATQVFPFFHIAEWVVRWIVVAAVTGFPVAILFSWFYEWTPQGLQRESEIPPNESITRQTGKKLDKWIIATLALAVVLLLADKLVLRKEAGDVAGAPPEKSIAVLPFANLSEDKANAYFAEGVQDEILTRLAKVADLKVISRTSTQHFKSSPDNLPEIARQLGVAHILEGSVQKANDQVRVNVQLINAATDAHLWAEIYDQKLTDIFAVESEIAKKIADALQAKLSGSEKIQLAKKPTANPEAYELYLKGRFFWNKRTGPDLRKAIDYFTAASAKDPDYALAYAALAQSWVLLPAHNAAAPKDCVAPAEAAISKALVLDETSSDAHAALGLLRASFQFNYSGATTEFDRALQLNPNDSTALHWSAMMNSSLGQSERAIAELRRALEVDPLSLIINTNLGVTLIHARRLDEAIIQLRKTIELDASFAYAHRTLGLALELQGKTQEAIAEYQKSISLGDDAPGPAQLAHLYGKLGRKDEATALLSQLQARRERGYVDPYWFALAYLGLGDHERAIAALEQSYADGSGDDLSNIRVEQMFAPLHGEPRFEALAEKIVPAREFAQTAPASK